MSRVDFSKLLSRTEDQVVRPVPLPVGTYNAGISGYTLGESSTKKTPYVQFELSIIGVGADVDQAELEKVPNGAVDKKVKVDFYLSENAEFRLWDAIAHAGVETSGKTLQECLDACINQSIGIFVHHETSEDGKEVYSKVKRTLVFEN